VVTGDWEAISETHTCWASK